MHAGHLDRFGSLERLQAPCATAGEAASEAIAPPPATLLSPETPRFACFRLTYPSGTVIDAYYGDGATLEDVRVTHPLATVEAVKEES